MAKEETEGSVPRMEKTKELSQEDARKKKRYCRLLTSCFLEASNAEMAPTCRNHQKGQVCQRNNEEEQGSKTQDNGLARHHR